MNCTSRVSPDTAMRERPLIRQEDHSSSVQGGYRLADILNNPVQWEQQLRFGPSNGADARLQPVTRWCMADPFPTRTRAPFVRTRTAAVFPRCAPKRWSGAKANSTSIGNICRDVTEARIPGRDEHVSSMRQMIRSTVAVRPWKFWSDWGSHRSVVEGFGWWLTCAATSKIEGQEPSAAQISLETVVFDSLQSIHDAGSYPFPQQCTTRAATLRKAVRA